MRKIIVCTFLTLDGVMQAPGSGPDEDAQSGFGHGGWQKPVTDDEVGTAVAGWYRTSGAMLLGRKTYEIFASYWPTADPGSAHRAGPPKGRCPPRPASPVSWSRSCTPAR